MVIQLYASEIGKILNFVYKIEVENVPKAMKVEHVLGTPHHLIRKLVHFRTVNRLFKNSFDEYTCFVLKRLVFYPPRVPGNEHITTPKQFLSK